MSDLANAALARLRDGGDWGALLAPDVVHDTLHTHEEGRDAVATLIGRTRFDHLAWELADRPGVVLVGRPRAGSTDRGIALTIAERDGLIASFAQQNLPAASAPPGTPMAMDAALQARFNSALADQHAMYIVYVDGEGRPHMSQRGSIRAIEPDALALWARAGGGLAPAVRANSHVALYFRDEVARATYNIRGRALVVEDETFRDRLYTQIPVIEQRHDFARLGDAILIELDLVEGYAGFTSSGLVDPVKLERER